MNNCLADLSRLIPKSYLKKGRGRIEKTEIIEMAIKHMNHLQLHSNCRSIEKCELSRNIDNSKSSSSASSSSSTTTSKEASSGTDDIEGGKSDVSMEKHVESFRIGYHECLSEVMHFMVEKEGLYSGDALCVRVMNHLQRHYEKLNRVKSTRQASNRFAGLPFIRGSSSSNSSSSSSAPFTSGSQALPGMGHPGSSLHLSQMESQGSLSRPNSMMVGYQMNSETGSLSASDSDYGSLSRPSDSSEFSSQPYLKPKVLSASLQKDRAEINLSGKTGDSIRSYSPSYEMEDDQSSECRSKPPSDQPENLSLDGGSFVSSHPDLDRDHAGCYKFKETIRQRFSDEYGTDDEVHRSKRARLESTGEPSSGDHAIKHERKMDEDDSMQGSTGEYSSGNPQEGPLGLLSYAASTLETHINENPPRRPPHVGPFLSQPGSSLPTPHHASKGRSNVTSGNVNKSRVPIFALHPRGTFYIPLSIEHALIAPHLVLHGNMDESNKSSQPSSGSPLVLHPITINVNFCGPFQSVISLAHPMAFPAPPSELGPRSSSALSESQTGQNQCVTSMASTGKSYPSSAHRTSRTVPESVPQWRERLDQILSPNKPMHLSGSGESGETQMGK